MAHAKLSPSAAGRWLKCLASPSMEEKYPVEASVYAAEGTFAHSLAELCTKLALGLIKKTEYNKALKDMQKNEFYNQEMLEHCETYSTYIVNRVNELKESCPDLVVELEVQLDLSDYVPEGFGTADCVIVAEPILQVIDFKYGKGVAVEAKGNQQMELYALGALAKYGKLYDVDEIQMTIVQPRLGGISEASIDKESLIAWATTNVVPLAKKAFEGSDYFWPSEETCKFCRARQDCRARADHFLKLFDENPVDDMMTPDEAGRILELASGITDWLGDLEAKVTESLYQGKPVTGWKLVAGRSNRKYADEEKVAEVLKTKARLKASEIYTKKLITVTEAEKILGKKKFADLLGGLVVKPEGKPTLAPANDKRPEVFPADEVIRAFDED